MSACKCCGKPRPEHAWRSGWAHGCCGACYQRWRRHGCPADGPPAPRAPEYRASRGPWAKRGERIEDCAELISFGVRDRRQLARRLDVSVRTIERYLRDLRAMAGAS